jgi:hypothetical protein
MGVVAWLVDKEKRFAWSLLGAIIGLISMAVAYVTTLEKRPKISFVITNEANVVDVHAPTKDLRVLFQNQDLTEGHLNLRILAVRVENSGDVDILQGQYDQNEAWGFEVRDGRVVEARVTSSNSAYLAKGLHPSLAGSRVTLAKPIFERGRFAVLETLVVHDRNSTPTIHPFGKIAGINQLGVTRTIPRRDERSISQQLFSGPLWVQAIRVVAYPVLLLGVVLFIFAVASLIGNAGESISSRRRRREVNRAKEKKAFTSPLHELFFSLYVEQGADALNRVRALLLEDARLKRRARFANSLMRELRRAQRHGPRINVSEVPAYPVYRPDDRLAVWLIENGVITVDKQANVTVDPAASQAVADVIAALKGGTNLANSA